MKYLKLFEDMKLDLSDYDEDWEESPNNYDDIFDQMKNYVDNNNLMGINVTKENWKDFAEMCLENDIIWASKRPVDIDDKNIEKRDSIVVTVHPFKTNKNKLKIKFIESISKFKKEYKKEEVFIFDNKKIILYSPISKKIKENFNFKELDPFNEEDWNEEDKKIVNIVKVYHKNIGTYYFILNTENEEHCHSYINPSERQLITILGKNESTIDDSLIKPLTEEEIQKIKSGEIKIDTFYLKDDDNEEIDIKKLPYTEILKLINLNDDDIGFVKENFDWNDDDFDYEDEYIYIATSKRSNDMKFWGVPKRFYAINSINGNITTLLDGTIIPTENFTYISEYDIFDIKNGNEKIITDVKSKFQYDLYSNMKHKYNITFISKNSNILKENFDWVEEYFDKEFKDIKIFFKHRYNENFDFNDEDFDEEEYNPNVVNNLVDAMVKIIIDDFNNGELDPYDELISYINDDIKFQFLWIMDWEFTKNQSINDLIIAVTEYSINNDKINDLKKFFKLIVENYKEHAIGFLELWNEFK